MNELAKYLTEHFSIAPKFRNPSTIKNWGETIPVPIYSTVMPDNSLCNNNLLGNILNAAKEFYCLEAMRTISLKTVVPFMKSHEKWENDIKTYQTAYTNGFASAIYDYIVKVVAGELRHAELRCSIHVYNFMNGEEFSNRNEVFEEVYKYDPKEVLTAGAALFSSKNSEWATGYGGPKWEQIAKAGLMFGKVPNSVFVDHCVDLSHNNSSFFDKGADMFSLESSCEYLSFLGDKRYAEPEQVIVNCNCVSEYTESLIRKGVCLGILPKSLNNALTTHYHEIFKTVKSISTLSEKILSIEKISPKFNALKKNQESSSLSLYSIRPALKQRFKANEVAWNALIYKPCVYKCNPLGSPYPGTGPKLHDFQSNNICYSKNYRDYEDREHDEDYEEYRERERESFSPRRNIFLK